MDARTGINQVLLDSISRIEKDWEARARLTKLVERPILLDSLKTDQESLNDRLNDWNDLAKVLKELSDPLKKLQF